MQVREGMSDVVLTIRPGHTLREAAEAMIRGGFRHLVVVDGGELLGVLSMRDIVRVWTGDGATCDVPAAAGSGAG